jgi:hypothetical protein
MLLILSCSFNFGNTRINVILVSNYKAVSLKKGGGDKIIFFSQALPLMVSDRLLYGTCLICNACISDVQDLYGLKITWSASALIFEVMYAIFKCRWYAVLVGSFTQIQSTEV